MRIEWKDTHDVDGAGQFVVFAENEVERGLLRRFTNQNRKKGWKFWMHGSGYSCDLHGVTNFNFGFVKEEEDKGMINKVTSTGTYYNSQMCRYEMWAVNQKTQDKLLIGWVSGEVPKEYRQMHEREVWGRLLSQTILS